MKPSPFTALEAEAVPCTVEDLPHHYSLVQDLVQDLPKDLFIERMEECITAETAYKLPEDDCFLYYLNTSKHKADGRAIYGKGNSSKFLTLLLGIFGHIDHNTAQLRFAPHKKDITDFKTLATMTSLHRFQVEDAPIVIRADLLRSKFIRLMKLKGQL